MKTSKGLVQLSHIISLTILSFALPIFAQPSNNNFTNAAVFEGESTFGTNEGATREEGEPEVVQWPGHDPSTSTFGGKSVWWKWVAPASGIFTVKTGDQTNPSNSSNFDTQLGVFTGTNVSRLTPVASNEDHPDFQGLSRVDFKAVQGRTYFIMVDGRDGATGNIVLFLVPTRFTFAAVIAPDSQGLGSVFIDPAQPTDGFLAGTVVTVTATPNEGVTFLRWSGATNGTSPTISVLMNSNKTVTATFIDLNNAPPGSQIVWQHANGQLALWFLSETQMIGSAVLSQNPTVWQVVGAANVNGAGSSDLLFQNPNGQVAAWLMEGINVTGSVLIGQPAGIWRVKGVSDFDNDGDTDFLFQNPRGPLAVWFMDGLTVTNARVIGNPGPAWQAVGLADLNSDNEADIVFQNSAGSLAVWFMNNTNRQSVALVDTTAPGLRMVGIADFNRDGQNDFLFQNGTGLLTMWLMNGLNRVSEVFLGSATPTPWRAVAVK